MLLTVDRRGKPADQSTRAWYPMEPMCVFCILVEALEDPTEGMWSCGFHRSLLGKLANLSYEGYDARDETGS